MPKKIPKDDGKLCSLLKEWSKYDPSGEKFRKTHPLRDSQHGFERYCSTIQSFQADGNNFRLLQRLRFILCATGKGENFEVALEKALEKHPIKVEALRSSKP